MRVLVALLLCVAGAYSWGVIQAGSTYRIYAEKGKTGQFCGLQNNKQTGGVSGVKRHEKIAKFECSQRKTGYDYEITKAGDGGYLLTDTYTKCGMDYVKEHGHSIPGLKGDEHLAKMDCKYGALPVYVHNLGSNLVTISQKLHGKQCGLEMSRLNGGLPGFARTEKAAKFDCGRVFGDKIRFDLVLKHGGIYTIHTYHDGVKCYLRMSHLRNRVTGVQRHERLAKFDCRKHAKRQRFLAREVKSKGRELFYTLELLNSKCGLQVAKPQKGRSNAGLSGSHETVAKFDCKGKKDYLVVSNGALYVPVGKSHTMCALQAEHRENPPAVPGVRKGELVAKFDCKAHINLEFGDKLVFKYKGQRKLKKSAKKRSKAQLVRLLAGADTDDVDSLVHVLANLK